ELRRREVDADDAGAATREPRAEVRGSAPELDDVLAVDVRQDLDLRLAGVSRAPRDLLLRPRVARTPVRVLRVRLRPRRPVDGEVVRLRQGRRGTRARSRARPTRASRSRARDCSASRPRTVRA